MNMNSYNISDPEELLTGKIEFDNIEKVQYEIENKEWKKNKIEEYVSKLNLADNIFTFQDEKDNIQVIPYALVKKGKGNVLYYNYNNSNEKLYNNFISYINNLSKLHLRKLSLQDYLTENLTNRYYVIKDKSIYVWD